MTALVLGNRKLSKRVAIFSLPPVLSCPNCETCRATCYAIKVGRLYPSAREKHLRLFDLAKSRPDVLEAILRLDLEELRGKPAVVAVRIHSSGDFFSAEYVAMWARIARDYRRRFRFYAFTKAEKVLDLEPLEAAGVDVIPSIIDGFMNYGPAEHVGMMRRRFRSFVCPAGEQGVQCGEGCRYCFTKKNVVFLQH